jgi:hypothetical protein
MSIGVPFTFLMSSSTLLPPMASICVMFGASAMNSATTPLICIANSRVGLTMRQPISCFLKVTFCNQDLNMSNAHFANLILNFLTDRQNLHDRNDEGQGLSAPGDGLRGHVLEAEDLWDADGLAREEE